MRGRQAIAPSRSQVNSTTAETMWISNTRTPNTSEASTARKASVPTRRRCVPTCHAVVSSAALTMLAALVRDWPWLPCLPRLHEPAREEVEAGHRHGDRANSNLLARADARGQQPEHDAHEDH